MSDHAPQRALRGGNRAVIVGRPQVGQHDAHDPNIQLELVESTYWRVYCAGCQTWRNFTELLPPVEWT